MAFSEGSSSASRQHRNPSLHSSRSTNFPPNFQSPQPPTEAPFEIFDWYPHMESSRKYFLDHAQHTEAIQALAAFINITLPHQRNSNPVISSTSSSPSAGAPGHHLRSLPPLGGGYAGNARTVSLIPYIRRLIATGFDNPDVLHGFFGDDWKSGVGPIHEIERRNYLFAAKSSSWLKVKSEYDMDENQTVPFLRPLQKPTEDEIKAAESMWSEWLAMQDWMVGPRAPPDDLDNNSAERMDISDSSNARIKREPTC